MPIPNLSIVSKKIIVTRFICLCWLAAKAISWKVWLADRLFPLVPPFNFLMVHPAMHLLLFIFSMSALFALMIFPANRMLQVNIILIEVVSCLLDQNRWQPWEYQYIFIILALVINYKNEKNVFPAIAFILISTYFFSGLGKMNPVFSISLRNKIVNAGFLHASNSPGYEWLEYHIGYLLGFIETLLGLGLLFKPVKKISAVSLIVMHLLILAVLGPFGTNYDKVVWPWNILMIVVLSVFFISDSPVSISFQSIRSGWNKVIVTFFGILPVLNFFGYWDFYLSSSLFSNKPPAMYICIHEEGSSKVLRPFFASYSDKFLCDNNSKLIDMSEWAYREMHVPPYPEIRIYKNIKGQLLKRFPDMKATFTVHSYLKGRRVITELK